MSLSSRSLSMTRTKLTSNARQAYSSILYPNPSTHPHVFMIQPLYLSGEGRRHDNYRVLLTYDATNVWDYRHCQIIKELIWSKTGVQ